MRQQNVEVLTHLFLKRFCASTSTRVVPHPMLRPSALDGVICWPGIFPFLSLSSLISWYIKFVSQCKFSTFQTLFLSLSLSSRTKLAYWTVKNEIFDCFTPLTIPWIFIPRKKVLFRPVLWFLWRGFFIFLVCTVLNIFSLFCFIPVESLKCSAGFATFFFHSGAWEFRHWPHFLTFKRLFTIVKLIIKLLLLICETWLLALLAEVQEFDEV